LKPRLRRTLAFDGASALQTAHSLGQKLDVLVIDLSMPGTTGDAFAQHLAELTLAFGCSTRWLDKKRTAHRH
jgi:CheY-like chemotaxis protein